ncbi:MAG: hypothetical protein C0478_06145 [Planctomyces sp.]|nr:hypothetical protein [Planctomyces sp.]
MLRPEEHEAVSAWIDGESPPEESVRVENLLASSDEARELADTYRRNRKLLQEDSFLGGKSFRWRPQFSMEPASVRQRWSREAWAALCASLTTAAAIVIGVRGGGTDETFFAANGLASNSVVMSEGALPQVLHGEMVGGFSRRSPLARGVSGEVHLTEASKATAINAPVVNESALGLPRGALADQVDPVVASRDQGATRFLKAAPPAIPSAPAAPSMAGALMATDQTASTPVPSPMRAELPIAAAMAAPAVGGEASAVGTLGTALALQDPLNRTSLQQANQLRVGDLVSYFPASGDAVAVLELSVGDAEVTSRHVLERLMSNSIAVGDNTEELLANRSILDEHQAESESISKADGTVRSGRMAPEVMRRQKLLESTNTAGGANAVDSVAAGVPSPDLAPNFSSAGSDSTASGTSSSQYHLDFHGPSTPSDKVRSPGVVAVYIEASRPALSKALQQLEDEGVLSQIKLRSPLGGLDVPSLVQTMEAPRFGGSVTGRDEASGKHHDFAFTEGFGGVGGASKPADTLDSPVTDQVPGGLANSLPAGDSQRFNTEVQTGVVELTRQWRARQLVEVADVPGSTTATGEPFFDGQSSAVPWKDGEKLVDQNVLANEKPSPGKSQSVESFLATDESETTYRAYDVLAVPVPLPSLKISRINVVADNRSASGLSVPATDPSMATTSVPAMMGEQAAIKPADATPAAPPVSPMPSAKKAITPPTQNSAIANGEDKPFSRERSMSRQRSTPSETGYAYRQAVELRAVVPLGESSLERQSGNKAASGKAQPEKPNDLSIMSGGAGTSGVESRNGLVQDPRVLTDEDSLKAEKLAEATAGLTPHPQRSIASMSKNEGRNPADQDIVRLLLILTDQLSSP